MATIRKRQWQVGGVERSAWICDYADQGGRRHIKTFETKRAAERWSIEALHQVAAGTHTPASESITVGEAFRRWIEHCEKKGLEFSTLRQRRQHLRLHVEPFLGNVKLSDLTLPRVHRFNDQLRDNGRSLAMRRKIVTNLGTAIKFAQSQGLAAQNVVTHFTLRRSDRDTSGPLRAGVDFPNKGELKAMLDHVPDRHRAFIVVLIFTGMRISEIRGLRWQDVDLNAGVLHVRQRATLWGRIGPPKSKAGSRDIPLVPMCLNALRTWRPQCPKSDLDLVFCNRHGGVANHAHLEKLAEAIAKSSWRQTIRLPRLPTRLRVAGDRAAALAAQAAASGDGAFVHRDDLQRIRPSAPEPGGRPGRIAEARSRDRHGVIRQ
jgi:integrase